MQSACKTRVHRDVVAPRAFTDAAAEWVGRVGTARPSGARSERGFVPWPASSPPVCATCGASTTRTVRWSAQIPTGLLIARDLPECDDCVKRAGCGRLVDWLAGITASLVAVVLVDAVAAVGHPPPGFSEPILWSAGLIGLFLPAGLRRLFSSHRAPILAHRGGAPGSLFEVKVGNLAFEAALRAAANRRAARDAGHV
jgi:hypothetical protein